MRERAIDVVRYNMALHLANDPSASQSFVEMHVHRPEATHQGELDERQRVRSSPGMVETISEIWFEQQFKSGSAT